MSTWKARTAVVAGIVETGYDVISLAWDAVIQFLIDGPVLL